MDEGVNGISGKAILHKFPISLDRLVGLIEQYRNRKFDEDIMELKHKFEGVEGLSSKLKTDIKTGIDAVTILDRENDFGSNRKDPPKISGF